MSIEVEMKELEKWCGEATERWNKKQSWDFYCVAKDMWLLGFAKARQAAVDIVAAKDPFFEKSITIDIFNIGQHIVKVELPGTQIGSGEK